MQMKTLFSLKDSARMEIKMYFSRTYNGIK